MKLRPQSFEPTTIEGYQQPLIRPRDLSLFGIGCGRWLFVFMLGLMTVCVMCVATLLFYRSNPPEKINILVVGVDARTGQATALSRTDAVMIMSLDPQSEEISLLSVPRDVIVTSPNFGDLPVNVISRNAELNTPGEGMNELVTSIETTLNIEIDYWVRFDFNGFVSVVDALGGVTVDIPKRIVDTQYPTPDGGTEVVIFEPGITELNGDLALRYTRTRHSDTDYDRADRQQQVVQAIVAEMTTVTNFPRLPSVANAITSNTETDMPSTIYAEYFPTLLFFGGADHFNYLVIRPDFFSVTSTGEIVKEPDLENDELNDWLEMHLRKNDEDDSDGNNNSDGMQ